MPRETGFETLKPVNGNHWKFFSDRRRAVDPVEHVCYLDTDRCE
jgi:hypothetical protein